MAKEKNSFVLYYDLEDILLDLSDSQIAELFRAIFAYEKRGEFRLRRGSEDRHAFRE